MNKTADHIFKNYLRRLTRLVGNNRSLLLLRETGQQVMDLSHLNHVVVQNSFEVIEALIAGKRKSICPLVDSRMEAANVVSDSLKRLQRMDQFLFEEKGTRDLHVGWPILRGKFMEGTPVRAPLLFFPVELMVENGGWMIQVRKDAELTFNKSWLLAYFHFNQVPVNEALLEASFDEFDPDSTVFRTQLYQLLKDKIEINFNPDTFSSSITRFESFTRDQFDKTHREGEIKLFPEAVLGIFPQADSQLVPDYLQLINENSFASLEDFFSSKAVQLQSPTIRDPISVNLTVKEEKVLAPFKLDAWQEHALKSVKLGNSLVVQGPPGSGKSQLIANLIADNIASGKKVLLVCQKRVALDVVFERLHSVGLSPFTALVHDFRDDRRLIFQKIATQIERVEDYRAQNRSMDIIQTERRFLQVCRTIDQLSEELEEFRTALFTDKECGLSAKELYLTSDPEAQRINLRQEYQVFDFHSLPEFIRKLKAYVGYAKRTEADDYPWKNRKSFARYRISDRDEIEKAIKDVKEFQENLGRMLEPLLQYTVSLEEAETILMKRPEADELAGMLADETVFSFFKSMANEKDEVTNVLWLQNMERVCMNCFEGGGVEASLNDDQIGKCQVALQERLTARRNIIRLIRWELFSEHKFFLKRILIANGLPYTKSGLRTLEDRLDNRLNLEHHLTALKERKWLVELPQEYDGRKFKKWFEKQVLAVRAKLHYNSFREISKGLNIEQFTRDEFLRRLWSVYDALKEIPDRKTGWLRYLTSYQVNLLAQNPGQWFNLTQQLRIDFDSLCEADSVKESFSTVELELIVRLYDELGDWDAQKFETVFQNSLRLAWIDHLEAKYPVLRTVSTQKMEQLDQELVQTVTEKQTLSTEIVRIKARERIYEHIEYNRLNNRVTYRDLLHQVAKKRKLWPVRKLLSSFQDELFNVIPCWMTSPESASALFPLDGIFDLVIFDEASQCFAERGLPAMHRGRQVVVAGDSQQLKPFDLYQVRFQEEEEAEDLEVDSLLDLTSRYLPTVSLQNHYRSQSMELIEFSNQNFYKGKLRMLPDQAIVNKREPAIVYIKVNGVWKDQTNQEEADRVVEKVQELVRHHPELTVGVVTFNAPQQELILDCLEAARAQHGHIPESIFVKNIENVQGDERDVIIFSTAYAADKAGKLNMQFGSLNVAGGENRLNVAVTRARQKVIIITSIWPEELKLQGVKNEGPKLLRAYLDFARQVAEGNYTPILSSQKRTADWYLSSVILNWSLAEKLPCKLAACPWPGGDIVLMEGTEYRGLLMCDDDAYEQMITIKDAHVYTPQLMEQKSWPRLRVHSRSWWNNKEPTQQDISRFAYLLSRAEG
ncbi:AAA domain-containing protein [Oscillatoria amoena NRMC-F 0135]|nr:AAA domain-containing protein [Oscillatoria amoena NRMC-F 0135]